MPRRLTHRIINARRSRALALAGLVALAALPGVAQALSFGALSVRSALNEPFSAVFDLRDVHSAGAIDIGMASSERFNALGLPRPAVIDTLRFAGQAVGDDRVQVTLTSRAPINEPFVAFVVRVATDDAVALHEYTAFLDPASERAPATAAASVDTAPETAPGRPGTLYQSRNYQVAAGDTLWQVARRFAPDNASLEQTALAIYQANPGAFSAGPATLQRSARLAIPDAARIRAVNRSSAERTLSNARSPGEDRGQPAGLAPVASGERPPPPDKLAVMPSETGETEAEGPDRAIQAAAPADAVFGTLVSGTDTPWPTAADRPQPSAPAAASDAGRPPSSTGAVQQPAPSEAAPPMSAPRSGPGLFRTRNIILALLLFLAAMLWLRQREQKRAATGTEASTAGGAAAGPARARRAGERPRATPAGPEAPAWLTRAARLKSGLKPPAATHEAPPRPTDAAPTALRGAEPAPAVTEETTAPAAPIGPAAGPSHPADAQAEPPPLKFRPTTIRPTPRRHDQGGQAEGLAFNTRPGETPAAADAPSPAPDERARVSWIDPAAFDLYDTPAAPPPADADAPTDDSLEIRLDLARMYIEMADADSARELLADVQARGDQAQRQAAARLLAELGA